MMRQALLALTVTLPLAATELPPVVPVGPVSYESVSYQSPAGDMGGSAAYADPYAAATGASSAPSYGAESAPTAYNASLTPAAASSGSNGEITINVFTSNYQVRGMGVTDHLSDCGYSSISGSYILPNRNLFNMGIYQRISGMFGFVWDASNPLGDTPLFELGYSVGKEILPNCFLEVGYSLRRGGLEGYVARKRGYSGHRVAEDLHVSLSYNDHQRGFFGSALWGVGFQGLTGSYFDFCLGYRFTDIAALGNLGTDVELSVGVAPSIGYWGGGVEGVDAWRVRLAFKPYSQNGGFGRDAHLQFTPWVQCSWSGTNAKKMDRLLGNEPVDHFQFTFGVDLGWKF